MTKKYVLKLTDEDRIVKTSRKWVIDKTEREFYSYIQSDYRCFPDLQPHEELL